MIIVKETCYKGCRILVGDEKRDLINRMIGMLRMQGFQEIQMPIIQYQEIFRDKVGQENNNLMFNFQDRAKRDICLAPEYTAVVQKLAKATFKDNKDVKLFYIQQCFRGEKPQAGRYREFTQFGVEVINPEDCVFKYLMSLAKVLLGIVMIDSEFKISDNVTRGLDYYKGGKGFEIRRIKDNMQLCGGGEYDGGIGFAIGIDRLI